MDEPHPPAVEAVARIDSAAGWSLNQSNGVAGAAPWLPKEGGEELYARGPDTIFAGGLFPPPAIQLTSDAVNVDRSSASRGPTVTVLDAASRATTYSGMAAETPSPFR